MTNSRRKGKVGELEFCRLARKHGYDAYRSQQYSGDKEKGDPDVKGLPGLHPEIKRRERLDLDGWLAQARSESSGCIPIVAHRRNNEKWKITMDADDFFEIYREWEAGQALEGEHNEY